MPTDRLLKYSIAGSTLLIFLSFFYLLFGGTMQALFDLLGGNEYLFKIIALVLATPFLGIMVSMIGFQSFVLLYGYKTYYYVPENEVLINWILEEKKLSTSTEKNLIRRLKDGDSQKKEFIKKLYPYYQVKVRKHIKDECLSFLERKWAVIWVHRNIRVALIGAIIFMIPHFVNNFHNMTFEWNKFMVVIFIGLYIILAHHHVAYSVRVATEYEHKLLMNAYENESS